MKPIFEGKHLLVLERDGWQYVERRKGKEAVAIIAETDDGRVILTEQFRRPVNARVIDFPAGLVGDDGNDDPEATAKKELEEETGYTCDSVELLVRGCTSPGITSEIVSLYRARGVRKVSEGGGVGGESITVHLVPRDEVASWLREQERQGLLIDVKLGLYFLSQRTLQHFARDPD
ncbi:MAG TPA: NUDIX hydrolase [Thermoanaerobaculia bacterium]|nr:NUDIX hydrolase [Thermoanaerobaculia bacterium]